MQRPEKWGKQDLVENKIRHYPTLNMMNSEGNECTPFLRRSCTTLRSNSASSKFYPHPHPHPHHRRLRLLHHFRPLTWLPLVWSSFHWWPVRVNTVTCLHQYLNSCSKMESNQIRRSSSVGTMKFYALESKQRCLKLFVG